jgi:hypothetical protein
MMAMVKLACPSLIPRNVYANGATAPVRAGERWIQGGDSTRRLRAWYDNGREMGWMFEMLRDGGIRREKAPERGDLL